MAFLLSGMKRFPYWLFSNFGFFMGIGFVVGKDK
jgi:hypothetical protein